jgi:hypothetical protein
VAGFMILMFLAVCYFIPTIVVFAKQKANKAPTIVVNFFLGWTFIGWIAALAMSLSTNQPQQVIVQNIAAPLPQVTPEP